MNLGSLRIGHYSYVLFVCFLKVTITVDGDTVTTIKEVSSSNPSCHVFMLYSLLPVDISTVRVTDFGTTSVFAC